MRYINKNIIIESKTNKKYQIKVNSQNFYIITN